MPPPNSLIAFAALAFAIIIIPGPSVMFVISRALSHGRRAALLTVVGNAAGFYAQVVLVAFGLGALLERSIVVYNTVKFVGALYLVWLGIQTFRRRRELAQVDDATELQPHRSILLDGFVVGVANPKTIVFFAAVLPQYVRGGWRARSDPDGGARPHLRRPGSCVRQRVGHRRRDRGGWFARSPRRLERLGGAGGIAIAALGVRLAVSRRE